MLKNCKIKTHEKEFTLNVSLQLQVKTRMKLFFSIKEKYMLSKRFNANN